MRGVTPDALAPIFRLFRETSKSTYLFALLVDPRYLSIHRNNDGCLDLHLGCFVLRDLRVVAPLHSFTQRMLRMVSLVLGGRAFLHSEI